MPSSPTESASPNPPPTSAKPWHKPREPEVVRLGGISALGDPIHEVVSSYKDYLDVSDPGQLKQFENRQKSNPQDADLEAALFSVAQSYGFEVTLGEVPGEGGVDFICRTKDRSFALEVTRLDTSSVERRSGVKNVAADGRGGTPSFILDLLRRKASGKANQLSGYEMPRVLSIGSTHCFAHTFMGKLAAEWLLTSEPKISVPIGPAGSPESEPCHVTSLEQSVFFKLDKSDKITLCRSSISAILLVGLYHDSCSLVGLLAPKPDYPFDAHMLPDVPFVRATNWPFRDGKIETEWTIADGQEKWVPLRKIQR